MYLALPLKNFKRLNFYYLVVTQIDDDKYLKNKNPVLRFLSKKIYQDLLPFSIPINDTLNHPLDTLNHPLHSCCMTEGHDFFTCYYTDDKGKNYLSYRY